MWSQELLFCLGHCIVHCAKVMEELKMNRSEIFNFAVRRCLYFTWCNILFVNNSKVCVLPEISLHIYHAIGPVRKQKLPHSSNLMTRQPSLCPTQYFTILITGILPFHGWKGTRKCWSPFFLYFQNINCLFTVLRCEQKQLAWFISWLIYVGLNFPP